VTSPGRLFCHVYGRAKGRGQMIPGWPYSVVAALEPGRTSWTAVLDAGRRGPADDEAVVTAGQVRDVVTRLIEAGHWRAGDPAILIVFDAGYDAPRLAWQLSACPSSCPAGCARTGCCNFPRRRASPMPWAGPASTAGSWPS